MIEVRQILGRHSVIQTYKMCREEEHACLEQCTKFNPFPLSYKAKKKKKEMVKKKKSEYQSSRTLPNPSFPKA